MKIINRFSESTIATLQKDNDHIFYVYSLVDPRNNLPFYIGKGKGNRIFAHKQAALGSKREQELFEPTESESILKLKTIRDILSAGVDVKEYILSYGLTQEEAFASENALINYAKLIQGLPLTNLVSGHGTSAMSVEEIEDQFGYQPMALEEIATNELILAVKVRDAFKLSKDESKEYPIDDTYRDITNLKSRTLGNWIIGKDKIHRIKYVIAVNTGADNAVVAAYEVSGDYSESRKELTGRTRYSFKALSLREETLEKLNLVKRSLPDLHFGSGSATAYINN
ncbi:LEM-3-like GIY-YIG domain-containing protein [Enterococcus dispar]|jgi:hypothetical protein|uniref:LEM-3-like GIY-YIG domain-containing protein n=1 Tax=Enterococcus dispar TaxID=44009 RepID=UPI002493ADCE|nr:hypothetical protein [Enterococcus dispar]MDT2706787.1 hypothetical protein [Enterococcus dispar]